VKVKHRRHRHRRHHHHATHEGSGGPGSACWSCAWFSVLAAGRRRRHGTCASVHRSILLACASPRRCVRVCNRCPPACSPLAAHLAARSSLLAGWLWRLDIFCRTVPNRPGLCAGSRWHGFHDAARSSLSGPHAFQLPSLSEAVEMASAASFSVAKVPSEFSSTSKASKPARPRLTMWPRHVRPS
jgi:hypothetical protein